MNANERESGEELSPHRLDYATKGKWDEPETIRMFRWIAYSAIVALAICVGTWLLMRYFQSREGGRVLERPNIPRDRVEYYKFMIETVPVWTAAAAMAAMFALGVWRLRREFTAIPLTLFFVAHFALWLVIAFFAGAYCSEIAFP